MQAQTRFRAAGPVSRSAQWSASALDALADPKAVTGGASNGAERRRVKELERELRRKDRALAEAAALLVLSKKLSAIFHEDADE